jgi:5-deoxy-glucuronate isomerase
VGGACWRWVRTIFDDSISHPNAELVLGEVVNMPGRWSSYPPHHHPQPEIYHYRFSDPRGFGHAELGESVLRVRHGDTVKILDEQDHAQCAAPGYGMWYLWVIRHLPSERYTVPEFTTEHAWTMDPDAEVWCPKEGAPV